MWLVYVSDIYVIGVICLYLLIGKIFKEIDCNS